MHVVERVGRLQLANLDGTVANCAALRQCAQPIGDVLRPDYADDNRCPRLLERPRPPFDIAQEFVQECRLDAELGLRCIVRRRAWRRPSNEHEAVPDDAERNRTPPESLAREESGPHEPMPDQSVHCTRTDAPRSNSTRAACGPHSACRTGNKFVNTRAISQRGAGRQASRASTAVYAGTAGLASAPTWRIVTSKSCCGVISTNDRSDHHVDGSLPSAASPPASTAPGSTASRSRIVVKPADTFQIGEKRHVAHV